MKAYFISSLLDLALLFSVRASPLWHPFDHMQEDSLYCLPPPLQSPLREATCSRSSASRYLKFKFTLTLMPSSLPPILILFVFSC